VEGCQCDHGFVRSGQQCVPEEQCGCTDDEGRYYVLGERFEKDGHLCICETGNDIICQECDEGYRPALRDGVWGCHRVDYPAVPCPEGYGDKYGFGKCLYVHKRPLIYSEAEAYCQGMDGKIFQFDNEDDVNRIKTILPSAGFGIWVGLTDEDTEGTFVWADGPPLVSGDFSDWAPQPYVRNSAQSDCVVMKRRFNWQWVVRSCSKANYFACESN
ncbi:snaclec trimecetin subunit beta-like, partial [Branchiostoma floridae]|uniref:Snaclec trimecetin subunit beta-like n=1 Tax=Branchiostoma floridae TaxID=7739 RepID=A0A9J7HRK4_BRAFL